MDNLGDKRKSYERDSLDREDLLLSPIEQFAQWYNDAEKIGVVEPNAMALATCNAEGQPSVRIVLLKGFSEKGFAFYSNYISRKARDLMENDNAALVFWWDKLERQVRIEGKVEKLDREESENYFHSRPRGSQLSAVASPQSRVVTKEDLNQFRSDTEAKYASGDKIPLPDTWGGFVLLPSVIEFWQGRANRYHDRFRYSKSGNNNWNIERLAP